MTREELLLGLASCTRKIKVSTPEDARASMERFLLRFIDDEDVADAYEKFMVEYAHVLSWAERSCKSPRETRGGL